METEKDTPKHFFFGIGVWSSAPPSAKTSSNYKQTDGCVSHSRFSQSDNSSKPFSEPLLVFGFSLETETSASYFFVYTLL
mmetsp:Transcript_40400/g.48434  ORF Transcript_40400/g.48434 Transcript_40400/m.48434 type:complete len:80 (+) Transcript_40400:2493-2732(+)